MGRLAGIFIVLSGLAAGIAIYWLQVFAFYEETAGGEVRLTPAGGGAPEPIPAEDVRAIDADSSPLRYRACFTTPLDRARLAADYQPYDTPVPLNGPRWFDCYDAAAVGAALEAGEALAFLGEANVVYGIDRVVAVTGDGRGFVWHQINRCGEEVFDGRPPPEGCPPAPQGN